MKEKDTDWVPTNLADYMDLDAMTTLLGDAIFNIEEEECGEACQHALKNPYEARTDDANDEGGEAFSDDDKGSGSEDDNSGDNDINGSEDSDGRDNSSDDSDSEGSNSKDYNSQNSSTDRGEPLSDRNEDVRAFYEDNSFNDVDYYNEDIKDDAEAVGGDYEEYPYGQPSD